MPEIDISTNTMILWAVVGYLLGSIPSGILLAKVMGLGNLREIGSGNIGATNVLRTGNKKAAVLTLIFDALKGIVAVVLARMIAGELAAQIAAFACMIGHCFPVWLKFKGGKGVATFFGVVFAIYWPLGLVCALTWLVVAFLSRYSSLAALLTAGLSITWLFALGHSEPFFLCVALALLIYLRHGQNIARLRAGTETKIGAKP
ncbi:glycerol-3-phosphate 1-O-acyltransferase PlsY [Algirhabdus cladophorae]|uniref:glycerol-3-phosphate 1-O-acyltransferase PlsY n=1 Tax=Algirhabdus cladophorae TaxID=3377108 RepID=UPI003B847B86